MIAAADPEGFRGIEHVSTLIEFDVIQLHFDADEIVFANRGALVLCTAARMIDVAALLKKSVEGYSSLPTDEANKLVACLRGEDAIAAGEPAALDQIYAAALA